MRGFAVAIMLFVVGCVVTNDEPMIRDGNTEDFAAVEPILQTKCGFLGCHGREGMPLTFYTVHYLRLRDPDGLIDDTRPALDEHNLSDVEVAYNRRALASRVGQDDPKGDRERFIKRLISEDQGGIPHADTVVFESPNDPQLEILRAFLETVSAQ